MKCIVIDQLKPSYLHPIYVKNSVYLMLWEYLLNVLHHVRCSMFKICDEFRQIVYMFCHSHRYFDVYLVLVFFFFSLFCVLKCVQVFGYIHSFISSSVIGMYFVDNMFLCFQILWLSNIYFLLHFCFSSFFPQVSVNVPQEFTDFPWILVT